MVVSVLAIVGRPNVGKSTLFNALTNTRNALVADIPGVTRDRIYGTGTFGDDNFIVIDTSGLTQDESVLSQLMNQQVDAAIAEADHILFLVDATTGVTSADQEIAHKLRMLAKPITVVVNKIDGHDPDIVAGDFASLGFKNYSCIAAAHRRGLISLLEAVLPSAEPVDEMADPEHIVPGETAAELIPDKARPSAGINVAIIGKPNVGKSTLINRMLGMERVVVCDMPGTTRDSIFIPFTYQGEAITFIDTAGIRRRSRVHDGLEKFSVIKSLQAIQAANVVIMVVDAAEGLTDQDLHLIGHIIEAGRGLVIACNKWDGLESELKTKIKQDIEWRLQFADFALVRNISALYGSNVGLLWQDIFACYKSATQELHTKTLTKMLEKLQQQQPPPMVHGRRIKLRYAHQGGMNPLRIIIHGKQTAELAKSYKRYLTKGFMHALKIVGTPLVLQFITDENPFAGKKNILTARQQHKRRRLIKLRKG